LFRERCKEIGDRRRRRRIRSLTYLRGEEMRSSPLSRCHRRRRGVAMEGIELEEKEK